MSSCTEISWSHRSFRFNVSQEGSNEQQTLDSFGYCFRPVPSFPRQLLLISQYSQVFPTPGNLATGHCRSFGRQDSAGSYHAPAGRRQHNQGSDDDRRWSWQTFAFKPMSLLVQVQQCRSNRAAMTLWTASFECPTTAPRNCLVELVQQMALGKNVASSGMKNTRMAPIWVLNRTSSLYLLCNSIRATPILSNISWLDTFPAYHHSPTKHQPRLLFSPATTHAPNNNKNLAWSPQLRWFLSIPTSLSSLPKKRHPPWNSLQMKIEMNMVNQTP